MNGRVKEGFYVLWTVAIMACVIASVFVLLYTSFTSGKNVDAPVEADIQGMEADGAPYVPEQADDTQQSEPQAAGFTDDVVFLGDSVIYSLLQNGALPKTQVWTAADGSLTLVTTAVASVDYYGPDDPDTLQTMTIATAVAQRQPACVVIALGRDGLNMLSEASFKGQYATLINLIRANSPDTTILCQSILPVIDGVADGADNASINTANDWIRTVAEENGLRYLNAHDALTDSNGNLSSAYADSDGYHLNAVGCNTLLTYVQSNAF